MATAPKEDKQYQNFEAVIERLDEGIVIVDLNKRVVSANKAAEDILGYKRINLIGKSYAYQDLPVKEVIRTGKPVYKIERPYRKPDGDKLILAIDITPLLNKEKITTNLLLSLQDITEHKKSEENLKLFSEAVEEAPDGIQIVDLNGYIVYSNNAVKQIYGFSPEEYRGKHVNEMNVDPEYASKVILPSIRKTGRWAGELTVKHKDGSHFPIWLTTSLVKDDKGKPIAQIGIIRDLTERKAAEETLKKAKEELEIRVEERTQNLRKEERELGCAKSYLEGILNSSLDLIFTVTKDGTFNYFNPSLEQITGYTPNQIRGKNFMEFIPEQYKEFMTQKWIEINTVKKFQVYKTKIIKADGSLADVLVSASVLEEFDEFLVVLKDITKRKQVEQELEFKSLLLDSAIDTIFVVDTNGVIIYLNEIAYKSRGYQKEELLGHKVSKINIPEDKKQLKPRIKKILEEGELTFESTQIKKDGSLMNVEVHSTLIDYKGKPVIISINQDITERRKAQEALKESEERFRSVVETATDAIIQCQNGKITYWNRWAEKTFCYKAEEIVGKPLTTIISESQINDHLKGINRVLTTGESKIIGKRPYEVVGLKKDVTELPLELSLAKGSNKEGIFFTAVLRDVTERKKAEADLKESEKRFRTLSESAFEGITIHEKGNIIETNQTLAQMFGYIASDLIGKSGMLLLTPESQKTVAQKISAGATEPYEATGLRKDGSTFPIEIRAKNIYYKGRIARVGAIRDITERKLAEEKIKKAFEEERKITDTLQKSLLPLEIPTVKGIEIKFHYQPTGEAEVGGDFYDVFETTADTYGILLGDVSGKGIKVAAETARVKYLVKDRAFDGSAPDRTICRVNETLYKQKAPLFTTLTYGLYNPKTSEFMLSNAGNPLPYFASQDRFIGATGIPVSLFPKQKYPLEKIELKSDDLIILYTDGIVEARRGKKLFGEKQIRRVIKENQNLSLGKLLSHLVHEARRFSNNNLRDDILVIGIKKR